MPATAFPLSLSLSCKDLCFLVGWFFLAAKRAAARREEQKNTKHATKSETKKHQHGSDTTPHTKETRFAPSRSVHGRYFDAIRSGSFFALQHSFPSPFFFLTQPGGELDRTRAKVTTVKRRRQKRMPGAGTSRCCPTNAYGTGPTP